MNVRSILITGLCAGALACGNASTPGQGHLKVNLGVADKNNHQGTGGSCGSGTAYGEGGQVVNFDTCSTNPQDWGAFLACNSNLQGNSVTIVLTSFTLDPIAEHCWTPTGSLPMTQTITYDCKESADIPKDITFLVPVQCELPIGGVDITIDVDQTVTWEVDKSDCAPNFGHNMLVGTMATQGEKVSFLRTVGIQDKEDLLSYPEAKDLFIGWNDTSIRNWNIGAVLPGQADSLVNVSKSSFGRNVDTLDDRNLTEWVINSRIRTMGLTDITKFLDDASNIGTYSPPRAWQMSYTQVKHNSDKVDCTDILGATGRPALTFTKGIFEYRKDSAGSTQQRIFYYDDGAAAFNVVNSTLLDKATLEDGNQTAYVDFRTSEKPPETGSPLICRNNPSLGFFYFGQKSAWRYYYDDEIGHIVKAEVNEDLLRICFN